jgi:hypothetical protein
MARTKDTLKLIGARFGMSEQAVETCDVVRGTGRQDQAAVEEVTKAGRVALLLLCTEPPPMMTSNKHFQGKTP